MGPLLEVEPEGFTWPWIIGTAIALIGILVGFWAARHYGNTRGMITFRATSAPILRSDAAALGLEVTYKGNAILAPYLAKLTITNTGRRDIPTTAFDADRPIRIRLGRSFFGMPDAVGGLPAALPPVGCAPDDSVIEVGPGLLKKGEGWSCSLLLSGEPTIDSTSVDDSLVDVEWRFQGTSLTPDDYLDLALAVAPSGLLTSIAAKLTRALLRA